MNTLQLYVKHILTITAIGQAKASCRICTVRSMKFKIKEMIIITVIQAHFPLKSNKITMIQNLTTIQNLIIIQNLTTIQMKPQPKNTFHPKLLMLEQLVTQ